MKVDARERHDKGNRGTDSSQGPDATTFVSSAKAIPSSCESAECLYLAPLRRLKALN